MNQIALLFHSLCNYCVGCPLEGRLSSSKCQKTAMFAWFCFLASSMHSFPGLNFVARLPNLVTPPTQEATFTVLSWRLYNMLPNFRRNKATPKLRTGNNNLIFFLWWHHSRINILCLIFYKLLLPILRSTFLFFYFTAKIKPCRWPDPLLTPTVGDWTNSYSCLRFGELLSVLLCSPGTVIPLMRHVHSRPTTISVLNSVVEWNNANIFNTPVQN